jgi:hypothetical protein
MGIVANPCRPAVSTTEERMKIGTLMVVFVTCTFWLPNALIAANLSEETENCLGCHEIVTPGIVGDWQNSRHASVSPAEGLAKKDEERRISASRIAENLSGSAVGCAECHTMNAEDHPDSFDHNGYSIHTVVSPSDCAVCHPVEKQEYMHNLMSQAHGNLVRNPVYQMMIENINGPHEVDGTLMRMHAPDEQTNADSCLSCHGTEVRVTGTETRETAMGKMDFLALSNWPNNGVGRVNPDGSTGACSSCHMRHQFSIETARKPYTCAQCHKGPDVPAYKVYSVSVHGNIQKSMDKNWNYDAVPWIVGKDFTAPTCATCHASLIHDDNGQTLAKRTHRMNDRLPWRIFGLPYAHPHPIAADTTQIVNQGGLNLPTELSGEPVAKFLIDEQEMARRLQAMKTVCRGCHSGQWVDGHFARLDKSIQTTNHMTLQATKILSQAWEAGVAEGLPQAKNPFDEGIEMKWIEQWLFFGNSTRFASAMGGADYGVFANGRWAQQKNLQDMLDDLKTLPSGKH